MHQGFNIDAMLRGVAWRISASSFPYMSLSAERGGHRAARAGGFTCQIEQNFTLGVADVKE